MQKFLLVVGLLLSLPAHAAMNCSSLKEKLAALNPEKKDWKEVQIPASELKEALNALPAPFSPAAKELRARLKKIKANPEAEFPSYLADNYANCTMRRAELRLALLNTAAGMKEKSRERRELAGKILATLRSERKFPTLISALADARTLVHGLEKGVFGGKQASRDLAHEALKEIETELAQENKTYGEPWGRVAKGLEAGTPAEKEAFLKSSQAWGQVRAHVLAEPEESENHLRKLRGFVARLQAN